MRTADALANYPFCSTSIQDGSFLGSTPEDRFMQVVWRIREWTLSATEDLKYTQDSSDPGFHVVVIIGGGAGVQIAMGSNDSIGGETDGYEDEEEILCFWRRTRKLSEIEDPNLNISPQATLIEFEAEAEVEPDKVVDEVDVPGAGKLSSFIGFTAYTGDHFAYLTTDPATGPDSGLVITLKVGGETWDYITLYYEDNAEFPTELWECAGEIVLEASEFWPWVVDGDPTWDTATGEQLEDPLRLDTNGSPRAMFVTVT